MKFIYFPFLLIICLFSTVTFGQWKSDSTTNTAICTASNSQQNPEACTDGSNGVIVVWEDFRSGTNWDVYAQKLSADGVPQWTSNGVNLCSSTANQTAPVICSDGSGGAYIVWKDTRTANNGTDLYAQHIGSDGSLKFGATGSGVAVAADAAAPNNISICYDGYGNAFVAWEDSRTSIASTSRPDIWMNRLTSGGVAWGGGGRSIVSQTLHQTMPRLVDDGSYGCYLVWVNGTLPASIWCQRFDANGGGRWTSPGIQVFEGNAGSSDASRNPSVSRDGSQLCVSWEQLNSSNTTNGWNMLANRVKSDGTLVWGTNTVGSEISTDYPGDQINSVVFSDDSVGSTNVGGLLVVYEDYSGTHDVVMTRLLPDGNTLRPAYPKQVFTVCRQNNNQTFPQAVKTGSGEVLIVWNDTRSSSGSSTYSSIYAQRCDRTPKRLLGPSPTTSSWGVPISNRTNSDADQVVLVPRTNGGIAVWRDNRNGNTDIYAQLIFRDGSLPVELTNFSVSAEQNGNVLLNWATASEKDNAGFEIERRMTGDPSEAPTFQVVGSYLSNSSLSGGGLSSSTRHYSFVDRPGKSGSYEYRLSDYSLDGERTVHEPKSVEVSSGSIASDFSVGQNIPNPFTDRTSIPVTLSRPAQVELVITDILGRTIANPTGAYLESGYHALNVSSATFDAKLSSGAFYYSITLRDPSTGSILWKMPKAQLMIKISN